MQGDLVTTDDYTFNSQGTGVVLTTGTTAGQQIRIRRKTPLSAQWVTFSDGSVLTSNQLNQAELFSLYCDQELEDGKSNIDGTVEGAAVKSVTGTAPITVDNTNTQTPVVGIDESDSTDDSNALTSDTRVMSEKAIDEAFKQYIGTAPHGEDWSAGLTHQAQFPARSIGQVRPGFGSVERRLGDTGPIGPAPGLQTPPASAASVPSPWDVRHCHGRRSAGSNHQGSQVPVWDSPGLTGPKGRWQGRAEQPNGADSTSQAHRQVAIL